MKNKLAIIALLSMSAPLFAVISDAEYKQAVQEELKHFQDPVDLRDRKVREGLVSDPLFYFASAGNLPVVEYLITVKHADPNKTAFENGVDVTALDLARIYGNNDVVEYLKSITKTRVR